MMLRITVINKREQVTKSDSFKAQWNSKPRTEVNTVRHWSARLSTSNDRPKEYAGQQQERLKALGTQLD